jgi:hypothetical protein
MEVMVSKGKRLVATGAAAALLLGVGVTVWAQGRKLGYDDTPFLPGGKWRVHDGRRPQPKIIDPGTSSTDWAPGRPPSDAMVLFDGTSIANWTRDNGSPTQWKLIDGALVSQQGGYVYSKQEFGPNFQLHLEWKTPTPPVGIDQGRGNSGVFFFDKYEIQVLDSFDNETYPDGQAAALYGQYPPLVNASRRPGEWQTYDIIWNNPKFDGSKVVRPAYITVIHNGVVVHNHTEVLGPMRHRTFPVYEPHGDKTKLGLQDHGNPVSFRNIWVRELKDYDQP